MAGRFDEWKAREPDPWPEGRVIQDRSTCRDCQATSTEEWYHFPTGTYCQSCYRVREARGELSDPRTRHQIHEQQRRTA